MKIGFKNTMEHEIKYNCHAVKYEKLTVAYLEQIFKNIQFGK